MLNLTSGPTPPRMCKIYDQICVWLWCFDFSKQRNILYTWFDVCSCACLVSRSHTEMRSTDVCILTVIAVNLCVLAAGFVSLGCYMHFYPGLATGNPSACFGHDCFFIAIFDTVSAHSNSGHSIQTSGYATFVEQ